MHFEMIAKEADKILPSNLNGNKNKYLKAILFLHLFLVSSIESSNLNSN